MFNILLIEDEIGLQITMKDRMVSEGYEVTIKGDGKSGEVEAIEGNYDFILLDIMLPGRDGFQVCENIRKKSINTPIIMLTARNTSLDTVIGLRQGADDYMVKPIDMTVLFARMNAIHRRFSNKQSDFGQKNIIKFGKFTLNIDSEELYSNEKIITLNALEFKVLTYLINNKDRVLSRDTLLDNIWGYNNETSSRTVDVHIARLRNKLEESEIPKHIQTVRGRGYKFIIS